MRGSLLKPSLQMVAWAGACLFVFLWFLVMIHAAPAAAPSQDVTPPALTEISQLKSLMISLCGAEPWIGVTSEFCSMPVGAIRFRHGDGQEIDVPVLVAADTRQRSAGYQHISPEVISQTAIFFVFPSEVRGPFHMCNVAAPLDIAWIGSDGSILDVQVMEPGPSESPHRCPALYSPRTQTSYRFALEAPHGYFQAVGLGPASHLVRARP